MGGLNIALTRDLHKNLEKSIELSTPLASFNNDSFEIQQCELEQTKISLRQKADMQRELISKKSRIENNLPEMKYTIQLASEKGASSWLNALPFSKHGFDLTKTEFCDGIAPYILVLSSPLASYFCDWAVFTLSGGEQLGVQHPAKCYSSSIMFRPASIVAGWCTRSFLIDC